MQVSGVLGMRVYTRQRRRATSIYHTDKDCSHLHCDPRPAELDDLPDEYTECQYCAGEYPGGGSTKTPISAKLKEMDPSEVGT